MAKTKNEQVESSKQSTKATPVDNKVDSSKIDKSKESTKVASKKSDKTVSKFLKARTKTQWVIGVVLLVAIYAICRAPDNIEFRDLSKEVQSIKDDIEINVKPDIQINNDNYVIVNGKADKNASDIKALQKTDKELLKKSDKNASDIIALQKVDKELLKKSDKNASDIIALQKVDEQTIKKINRVNRRVTKTNAKVNEVVDTINTINNNTEALKNVHCEKWFNDKVLCTDEQGFKSVKTIKKLR